MQEILKTDDARVIVFDENDGCPPGFGPGDFGFCSYGHMRDCFLHPADLKQVIAKVFGLKDLQEIIDIASDLPNPDKPPTPLVEGPGNGWITTIPLVGGGQDIGWKDDTGRPLVFANIRDAQLLVLEEAEDQIDEFKRGERDFDEIDGTRTEDVVGVTVDEAGFITDEEGNVWWPLPAA